MKKAAILGLAGLSLLASSAMAEPVHDWHDLDKVHQHVKEAIHEMERARAANNYDMAGHGAKAEELLRAAERELDASVAAAQGAR